MSKRKMIQSNLLKNSIAAYFASENNMIVTCGSDVHLSAHACLCSILTRNPLKDSF